MAIDTAAKRFSMMSMCGHESLIPPDGTFDQGDRQTFLGLYAGILAGAVAALPDATVGQTVYFRAQKRTIDWKPQDRTIAFRAQRRTITWNKQDRQIDWPRGR